MDYKTVSNEDLIFVYALFDDLRHLASWHGEVSIERSDRIAVARDRLKVVQEILEGLLPQGLLTERTYIVGDPNKFPQKRREGYVKDENGRKILYSTIFELISFYYYCEDMFLQNAYTDELIFERKIYSFMLLYKAIISKKSAARRQHCKFSLRFAKPYRRFGRP